MSIRTDTGYSCVNIKFINNNFCQKDKLPLSTHSNVIYKINCANCEASYVGQTCRLLKTRISEHRSYINRNNSQLSGYNRT